MVRTSRNTAPIKKLGPGKDDANLSIILLCAGESKSDKFKYSRSLIKFDDGQSLIYKQISAIYQIFPKSELIVVTGYDSKNVIKEIQYYTKKTRVVENENYFQTGAFRSAALGIRAACSENVLIIHGDLYLSKGSYETITYGASSLLVDNNNFIDDSEVGVVIHNNQITNLSYGLVDKWGQVVYLNNKELQIFKDLTFDDNNSRIALFEAINMIIDKDGRFCPTYLKEKSIIEIDYPRDIKKIGI